MDVNAWNVPVTAVFAVNVKLHDGAVPHAAAPFVPAE
jgi:hypothetical protein